MKNNIKVKINFISTDENESIDYSNINYSTNVKINNISNVEQLSSKNNNQNPFLLGVSKVGSGAYLSSKYEGLILIKDTIYQGVTLYIDVVDLNDMFILFDKNHSYSTSYVVSYKLDGEDSYINETTYSNDDNIINIHFDEKITGTIKILFEYGKWAYNGEIYYEKVCVIDAIYTEYYEIYDSDLISNLVIGNQLTSDNSKPSFSVIGQYGSFDLIDKDNKLETYIKEGILKDNSKIIIYYNDNIIGNFASKKWSKDINGKKISVELNDNMYSIDSFKLKISYHYGDVYDNTNIKNALNLFEYIFAEISTNTNIKNYIMTDELKEKLSNIVVNQPYHKEDTILNILNDFCEFAMVIIKINKYSLEVIDYV